MVLGKVEGVLETKRELLKATARVMLIISIGSDVG
jgi:hypothetical protein